MAKQLNVQQQGARALAQIEQAASFGAPMPQWLCALLQAHGLSPHGGVLVRYEECTEQEGNLLTGVWLTASNQFWEFAVMVSRDGEKTLAVEAFANITAALPISESMPGTGPSFGHLALHAVKSILAAASGPLLNGEGSNSAK